VLRAVAVAVAVVVAVVVAVTARLLLAPVGTSQPAVVVVEARPNDDPEVPFVFDPEVVEVTAGTTIRWTNRSRTFHTVTFGPSTGERVANGTFEGSMFEVGDVIERTFSDAGTFRYFCQPHVAFMAGSVIVTEP